MATPSSPFFLGLGFLDGMLQVASGFQQASALDFQASQAKQQARIEKLQARERANMIRQQLHKDLASANALFAASGANSRQITTRIASNAAKDIRTTQVGGDLEAAQLRLQAAQYNQSASAARLTGLLRGARTGLNTYTLIKEGGGSKKERK